MCARSGRSRALISLSFGLARRSQPMAQLVRGNAVFDPGFSVRLTIALFRLATRRIQVVGSTAWPMADGKIFTGDVRADDLQGWVTDITYSYVAFGEYYSGTYRRGFRRKKRAEAFLERLPRNTPLPVPYKPGRPETSTLLLSDLGLLLSGL